MQTAIVETASARAYRALEALIVTLELEPGSVATEGALVERLDLGRTPVREAIQRLAWEGLIVVRPRAGLAIAPLEPTDWRKVLAARRGPETVLAHAAAEHLTDATEPLFATAAEAIRRAAADGDPFAFLAADKALDEAIAAAADNPYAAKFVAPLQTHSRRFWFRSRSPEKLERAADAHLAIAAAIVARKPDRAAEAAAGWIDRLRREAG